MKMEERAVEKKTVLVKKEAYEKPLVIEYDSPTVSFTTMWDKSTS